MGTSLMGLELEKGGLDDLKLSFETGDGAYGLRSPKNAVRSPLALSLEMPEIEGEEDVFGNFPLPCLLMGMSKLTMEQVLSIPKITKIVPIQRNRKTECQNCPKPKSSK